MNWTIIPSAPAASSGLNQFLSKRSRRGVLLALVGVSRVSSVTSQSVESEINATRRFTNSELMRLLLDLDLVQHDREQ
jgi:hypothetical protein